MSDEKLVRTMWNTVHIRRETGDQSALGMYQAACNAKTWGKPTDELADGTMCKLCAARRWQL